MAELMKTGAGDLPQLAKLLNDVFRTGNGIFDQEVVSDFPLFFAPENLHNSRIIVEDNRILSHAGIWPCEIILGDTHLKLGMIVLVATHPDARLQGHAARLMRELQKILHEEDYDLGILWTGVPDFYQQLGWQVVVPRGGMTEDLRAIPAYLTRYAEPPAGTNITAYQEHRHLDGIIRLHDAEPFRITRSRDQYATLLKLPKIEVTVLERHGQVEAYLVAAQAVNKTGLIEYGGPPQAILTLAHHYGSSHQCQRPLPLLVFHSQGPLAEKIEVMLTPLECSKGRGCEMIYVARPERVTDDVRSNLFIWGLDFT